MLKQITRLLSSRFVKGGTILTISSFIVSILNYLFHSFSAKALGPDIYSEIIALFSIQVIFAIPIEIVSTVIIRKVGYELEHGFKFVSELSQWVLEKVKTWSLLIMVLVFFGIIFLPKLLNLQPASIITLSLIILLGSVSAYFTSIFRGLRFFKVFAIVTIMSALIKFTGPLFTFFGPNNLNTIYIFLVLSVAIPSLFSYVYYKTNIRSKLKENKFNFTQKRLSSILVRKDFIVTTLSLIALTVIGTLDIVYAKKLLSATDAGLYGSWNLFAKIVLYIVGPLKMLVLIFFSNTKGKKAKKQLTFVLLLLTGISMASFIAYSIFGEQLILLILSEKFLAIKSSLGMAALFGFFYSVIVIVNTYFIAKKSNLSLIVAIAGVFYVLALTFFTTSFQSLVQINLIFSGALAAIYLIFYIFD